MPAVTVADISVPAHARGAGPATEERPVVSVTDAPSGFEGEGFPVRRAFAGVDLAQLDPFVHMDQMGEVDYGPGEPRGTAWHPHRGFETVTYMIDGTFQHQDSAGGGRRHHQRRHPVDDSGSRHPPHRATARGPRHLRRPLPRHPAVGEPAVAGQVGGPRATRTSGRARSHWCRRPTAARWSGSSPGTSPATPGRG